MFKSKDAIYNFIYSFGAAIVIVGALFKITHWNLGPLTGNVMLATGLITEALIFCVFAFDPPKSEINYAWENVYPELLDENVPAKPRKVVNQAIESSELNVSLSDKLDKMLADAKLDVSLFERLKQGIDNFSTSVENINKVTDVSTATLKYNDQLTLAANHLESMNALYALQLEHGKQQANYHQRYVADLQQSAEQSEKFNQELAGLTTNLNNLNKVYGGMLNAMKF